MASFRDRRPDEVTYWPSVESDGFPASGPITAPIEEIFVRWEDLQEIFIDIEGRENVSRAVVYSDPYAGKGLNRGGYLMDSLNRGPKFVESYPPVVPVSLIEYLEYWDFNNTLNGANGNDFDIASGSASFDDGVIGESLFTDSNGGYVLDSQSDLSINDLEELTLSLWFKSSATAVDVASLALSLPNNLRCTIEVGQVNSIIWGGDDLVDITTISLEEGWAEEFVNIVLTWKRGEIQDISISGWPQSGITTSIYNNALTDNLLNVDCVISDGDIWLDELRVYEDVLAAKDIQTLAAIHPSQYVEAFEIRQTHSTGNLRGTKRIYKTWLKSKG